MPPAGWSRVDDGPDPGRLITGLDRLARDPFFCGLQQRLFEALDLRGGRVILEIGCGTGEAAAALAGAGVVVVGLDRSRRMLEEAQRRHPGLWLVAGEARRLPVATGAVDRVLAARVLHHLHGAAAALAEWRRVLRPGGRLVSADSDPATTVIEGVDAAAATAVAAWRASTRPGGAVVGRLAEHLVAAGFGRVGIESYLLELSSLDRADGIMGLADWGELAAEEGALDPGAARRWRGWVEEAAAAGRLRFRCRYVVGSAIAL